MFITKMAITLYCEGRDPHTWLLHSSSFNQEPLSGPYKGIGEINTSPMSFILSRKNCLKI